MRRIQSGRSMMEMMGVLCIMGLLSTGGLMGINRMFAQQKINKAVEQVSVMSAKLSQLGAQSGTYAGLDNTSAVKFGAVPASAIDSSGTLLNPFGGDIEIEAANLTEDEDLQGYTITYTGLSNDDCMGLTTYKWASSGSASLVGVASASSDNLVSRLKDKLKQDCNGEVAPNYVVGCSDANEDGLGLPIDPISAIDSCNCSEDECAIIWMYF